MLGFIFITPNFLILGLLRKLLSSKLTKNIKKSVLKPSFNSPAPLTNLLSFVKNSSPLFSFLLRLYPPPLLLFCSINDHCSVSFTPSHQHIAEFWFLLVWVVQSSWNLMLGFRFAMVVFRVFVVLRSQVWTAVIPSLSRFFVVFSVCCAVILFCCLLGC